MKPTSINEKTPVPIGLAVLAIGTGAWWLSALNYSVRSLEVQIAEVKADVKTLLKKSDGVAACPATKPGLYSMATGIQEK